MSTTEREYANRRIFEAQGGIRVGNEVFARHPRVLETEMGDDISLYDPAQERVTVLNTTASDIWRLLDGETPLRRVTDLLARAYDVEASRIAPDVRAAVEQLAEQDLLERKT